MVTSNDADPTRPHATADHQTGNAKWLSNTGAAILLPDDECTAERLKELVGALLVYEQSLVSADDLSQVKKAFDMNGYVGILYLAVLGVSIYVR